MLASYILQTQQLLQYPESPSALYSDADLTLWINRARRQLAGDSQSIRVLGMVSTVANQRPYNYSSINVSATAGASNALRVEQMLYAVGDGFTEIHARNWAWFFSFKMANVVPPSGPPTEFSQYGQGSAGSFYLDPIPDDVYSLTVDCVCLPVDLVDDTTVEAIPPLWQDAVCFYAAFLALLSAQSAQRQNDADRMFARYSEWVDRARRFATPDVNRFSYPQREDISQINKFGISPKAVAGAQ